MPGPSRPITDMDISTVLPKLFHSLPPRKGNPSDLADGYKIALHGGTREAFDLAVVRYIRGEIEGQSTSFAPSPPELGKAVREIDRQIKALDTAPAIAYQPTPFVTVQMRIDAQRERWAMEGRKFICSVESAIAAQAMAKRGDIPPGSVYSGLLGAFYSPPPKPEGSDNARDQRNADAPTGHEPEFGPAAVDGEPTEQSWRGLFATERATDEQTGNNKASDTIDGDGGFAGASIEARAD